MMNPFSLLRMRYTLRIPKSHRPFAMNSCDLDPMSRQTLSLHLQACDAFIHGHLPHGSKHSDLELPQTYAHMTLAEKGSLHRGLLLEYIRGGDIGKACGSTIKGHARRVKTLLQLIQDGVPMASVCVAGEIQDDSALLRRHGTKLQTGCEDMLEEMVAAIRLPYQLFGTSPGPVCELYVLLLQAYLLAGYGSGRFDGRFARHRQANPNPPIQASTRLIQAIPTHRNALALLAFARAEVDLLPAFPSGISNTTPRKLLSFADEHVMRMVLEALQDQAGKMRRGLDAAVNLARGAGQSNGLVQA